MGFRQALSIACWNITILYLWSIQDGKWLCNLAMKTSAKILHWGQELEDFKEGLDVYITSRNA